MTVKAFRTIPHFDSSFLLITGVALVLVASQMIGGGRVLLEVVGLSFDTYQNAMYVLHIGLFYILLGLLIWRGRALESVEQAFVTVGRSLVVVFATSVVVMLLVNAFLFPNPARTSLGYLIPERVLFFVFIAPAMLGLPLGVANRTGGDTAATYSYLLFLLLPFAGFVVAIILLNWSPLSIILVAIAFAIDVMAAIPLFFIGRSASA